MDMAMLYLRSAEVIKGSACGIYEIEDSKTKKTAYIIFTGQKDLSGFLGKNPGRFCKRSEPDYRSSKFTTPKKDQVRKLTEPEIYQYLAEQKRMNSRK